MPLEKPFSTKSNSTDGNVLYSRMITPNQFDSSNTYPVLIYVYGGPHAQLVTNSWLGGASLWMHWMANQGYLIYTLDGRGSANRGFEFESAIFRNLGQLEMKDQIEGVKFLKEEGLRRLKENSSTWMELWWFYDNFIIDPLSGFIYLWCSWRPSNRLEMVRGHVWGKIYG